MMQLLPWDTCVVKTSGTIPELVERLRQHVVPASFLPTAGRGRSAKCAYTGKICDEGFHLSTRFKIPLAPIPELSGRFVQRGTHIEVRIDRAPPVSWLTLSAVVIGVLSVLVFEKGAVVFTTTGSVFTLVWFMTLSGFWMDAGRGRRQLIKLLENAESSSTDGYSADASGIPS